MTNAERLQRAESILKRQTAGTISANRASLEMDELLYESSTDDGRPVLCYFGDSTGLVASWDADLMLFQKPDGSPSNTGIYARGPRRGEIVTVPAHEAPDCLPAVLAHFSAKLKN
jgi:hypothetical protein